MYTHISLFLKKKVTAGAAAAAVTKAGSSINENTKSFRNARFGIQVTISIKKCQMPSSKTKVQWGPHNFKSPKVLYRLLSKFGIMFHWNTGMVLS